MQEKVDQDGSAWVKTRTINTPTAKKLAEWILLAGDLEYALRRAVLWNELATTKAMSDNKCEISVSLFRDTVITFVSCFDNTLSAFLEPKVVYTTSSEGENIWSGSKICGIPGLPIGVVRTASV